MRKYVLFVVLLGLLSYFFKDAAASLSLKDYELVLSSLLNTSSIIFAIIGAWIAIIYPKAMASFIDGKSFADSNASLVDKDYEYLSNLLEILVVSAFVLMSILLINVIAPILKGCVDGNIRFWVKVFGLFFISFITFIQIYAVGSVILTNYRFLMDVKARHNKQKFDLLSK